MVTYGGEVRREVVFRIKEKMLYLRKIEESYS